MGYSELCDQVKACALRSGRDPSTLSIVAVSKGHSCEEILALYAEGCRIFAENRLEELLDKQSKLPADISWHLIGTLQTKKVGKAVREATIDLIHSIDTPKLADKLNRACAAVDRVQRVLIQVNTSGESTKHGLSPQEWLERIDQLLALPALSVCGAMTIAPLEGGMVRAEEAFDKLRRFLDELKGKRSIKNPLDNLSMGMSADFPVAIAQGATLLRIGSALFCSHDKEETVS